MTLTRLSAIDGEAILSLVDAKAHLRVTHDDEDALIGSLRNAAIGHVERVSGVALAPADYRWTVRGFFSRLALPMAPAQVVNGALSFFDDTGTTTTYDTLQLFEGQVFLTDATPPTSEGYLSVVFTAGLTSPDEAPELLSAVKLLLAHFYDNRETMVAAPVQEIPYGVTALINTYRRVFV